MKRINSFLMFILVALGICLAADMSASGIASDSAYLTIFADSAALKGQVSVNKDPIKLIAKPSVAAPEKRIALPAPASFSQQDTSLFIYGNVVYSEAPTGLRHVGIWKFNTAGKFIGVHPKSIATTGKNVYSDGLYYNYYQKYDPSDYYERYPKGACVAFDADTWEEVVLPLNDVAMDNYPLTLCADGGHIYGFYGKSPNINFGKFNPLTQTWTLIAKTDKSTYSCAYSPSGYVYFVDVDEILYRINVSNGVVEEIGGTICTPSPYSQSMVFDRKSGRLLRAFIDGETKEGLLQELNLSTGQAVTLCKFEQNDQILGLYIPGQEGDKVPAQASDLALHFTGGQLQGNVSFKCPSVLNDNTAASGPLTYELSVNGKVVATGSCAYGNSVTAPLTLDSSAMYTIGVALKNETGRSRGVRKTAYIGYDTPLAPTVNLEYASGKFNVTWSTPAAIHNGYVDNEALTYTLTRFPDNIVVGRNLKGNSFSDACDTPQTYKRYFYTVIAHNGDMSSTPGKSNIVPLGCYQPPYKEPFDSLEAIDAFVVIDGNKDGITWHIGNFLGSTKSVYISGSKTVQTDDWLISPPVALIKDKTYNFSIKLSTFNQANTPKSRYEIMMGREARSEAMNFTITPAHYSQSSSGLVYTWSFKAPDTGGYHFGVHAVTEKGGTNLIVDDFKVSAPLGNVPDAVTDLTAEIDSVSALNFVIRGKAPLKDINGNPVGGISCIKIMQSGTVVEKLWNMAPGEEFSISHQLSGNETEYRWFVVCENSNGPGKWRDITLNVNDPEAKPQPVTNLKAYEDVNGIMKVSWTAPTKTVGGKPLDPRKIRYDLSYSYSSNSSISYPVQPAQGDTSFAFRVESRPQYITIEVSAVNLYGKSEPAKLKTLSGKPYKLPYRESFGNGRAATLFSGDWSPKDNSFGIEASDDDNGYMACELYENEKDEFFSGKIDLRGAKAPGLSFYLYNMQSGEAGSRVHDLNPFAVMAREYGSVEWKPLLSGTVYDLCGGSSSVPNAWNCVKADLTPFKDKIIELKMGCTGVTFNASLVDKISVADKVYYDLCAFSLKAPDKVKCHQSFDIEARIENHGEKKVSDFKVDFYRDDEAEPFKVITGKDLLPDAYVNIRACDSLGIGDNDRQHSYYATVNCEADSYQADNKSAKVTVSRRFSNKPKPWQLEGVCADNTVALNWTTPVINSGYSGSNGTEDFESYDAWAYNDVGDWTFTDVDKQGIGTFLIPSLLGYFKLDIEGSPMMSKRAFMVIKNGYFGINRDFTTFKAHSGDQFLGSMAPNNGDHANDWLISPLLDGSAQTVQFFAKSYLESNPENIEMLYSLTTKEPSSFVAVKEVAEVPADWTAYSFDVPAGTRYFAVRNKGNRGSMLMLDDFSYKVAPMTVEGYYVYRDSKRVEHGYVPAPAFVDHSCPEGKHDYCVTALYNDGAESGPSNPLSIQNSVAEILDGIAVEGGQGFITIRGAAGRSVSVISASGITCYRGVPETDEATIRLPQGIYIVRIAASSLKITVR